MRAASANKARLIARPLLSSFIVNDFDTLNGGLPPPRFNGRLLRDAGNGYACNGGCSPCRDRAPGVNFRPIIRPI